MSADYKRGLNAEEELDDVEIEFLSTKRVKHEKESTVTQDDSMKDTGQFQSHGDDTISEGEINDSDDIYEEDDDDDEIIPPDDSLEKLGLPSSVEKFISAILSLDPSISNVTAYWDQLDLSSKFKSVTKKLTYESAGVFRAIYIPTVLSALANQITKDFDRTEVLTNPEDYFRDYFILLKDEFNGEIDFKCVSHRLVTDSPGPHTGDLIAVKTKYQRDADDSVGAFSQQTYFGLVLCAFTRMPSNDIFNIEQILLDRFPQETHKDYIAEENVIRLPFSNDLHKRNDYHLTLHRIANFHCYILQAKSLYKLEDNPLKDDLLNPKLTIKSSGLMIDENLKLPHTLLDTIQKSIDLISQNDPSSSKILACDVANKEKRIQLILAAINEMKKNEQFLKTASQENTSVMVISKDRNYLKQLYELLKSDETVCHGLVHHSDEEETKAINEDLMKLYQQHINKAGQDANRTENTVERYTKLIQYIKGELSIDDLASHWVVDLIRARKERKRQRLSRASVILSRLEDIYEEVQFSGIFNPRSIGKNRILCCFVDDASQFNEVETLSLSNFGVTKLILIGNSSNEPPHDELLTPKSLNRSLFKRFIDTFKLNGDTHSNSSVVILPND